MSNPAWLPVLFTPSLTGTEDFITDGDKLIKIVEKYFRLKGSNEPIKLDVWQKWLIRHVLERYPNDHPEFPGELRFNETVISVARQNGKSVLGSVFAIYALLMHHDAPEVISLASKVEQANIIYRMVSHAINVDKALIKRFKTTGTRGLRSKNPKKPANYKVMAGNGDTLQGASPTVCLFDEIHISKEEAWDAMAEGTAANGGLIIGITTAGDEDSTLLKRLYETGKKAAAQTEGYDERFGFFLWEAPAHLDIYSKEAILAANPSLACDASRLNMTNIIQKMKPKPDWHNQRYRLNQFISSENVWMPINVWAGCMGKGIEKAGLETNQAVVFIDRTPGWESAVFVAAIKREDGVIETEVIHQKMVPDIDYLVNKCIALYDKFYISKFVAEGGAILKDLIEKLRERGLPAEYFTASQMAVASSTTYSLVTEKRVSHANDPIVNQQLPRAVTENLGDGYRVSRKKSLGAVDAVNATVGAIYAAEITEVVSHEVYGI